MKIRLFVILSLVLLSFNYVHGITSGGDSAPRDKVLNKMIKWISTYFTLASYRKIANALEPKMKANMTSSEATSGKHFNGNQYNKYIYLALISAVMGGLSFTQSLECLAIGASFMSACPDINPPINIISTVMMNNLWPFGAQLIALQDRCAKKSMTDKSTWNFTYRKIDQFMTQKRCNTNWCRVYIAFNKYSPSLWTTITSSFKKLFVFSVFDLSKCSASG